MEENFLLSNLHKDEILRFFQDVLDPIMFPMVDELEDLEHEDFEYQLMYFSWLIYAGKVRPDWRSGLYPIPLIFDEDITPVQAEVLLGVTHFPDLYSLAQHMRLPWHCLQLFEHSCDENVADAWDIIPFMGDDETMEDACYTLEIDNDYGQLTIVRFHSKGPRKGMVSIISHNDIKYLPTSHVLVSYYLNHPQLKNYDTGVNPYTYCMTKIFGTWSDRMMDN